MDILKNEAGKFEATMASVVKNNITSKETQIKDIDDETQKKTDEIKRLTDEINELQSQKGTVSNEISQQKAKVEQAQNNFGATLKVFIDKINTDLGKIKKYLLTSTGGSNV
jgi:predicted  nucleic acid-binding Zn-ribbon protein